MKKALFLILPVLLLLLAGCGKGAKETWIDELPWSGKWTCLLLGNSSPAAELEPEAGKEALRTLLKAYRWTSAEPAEVPGRDVPPFRLIQILCGEGDPLTLTLNEQGDLFWNDRAFRPLGDGAGEKLLEDLKALQETGIDMLSPPPLVIRCGDEEADTFLHGTYTWSYRARSGQGFGCMGDAFTDAASADWENFPYSYGPTLLPAEGEVSLSFTGSRMPDRMGLSLNSTYGSIPVELRDGRFTPLAGVNAYLLSAEWDPGEQGGSGSGLYVLLVDGSCPCEPPKTDTDARLTLVSADVRGCELTLTAGSRVFSLGRDRYPSPAYHLLRRTDFGSWAPVKPERRDEPPLLTLSPGETVSFRLDWSRELGILEPGEYCLLLRGYTGAARAAVSQNISLCFTLEDRLPAPPGPSSLQALPEGFETALRYANAARWTQTVTLTGEGKYAVDRDYALFRLGETGALTYVPPAYALPAVLNRGKILTAGGGSLELDVELAALYDGLEPGTYVLRRRLLRLEKGEQSWDWRRTPAEDRLIFLDTSFTLGGGLTAVAGRVEPFLPSPVYDGKDPTLPLRIIPAEGQGFDDTSCRFTVKNLGEREWEYCPEDYTLYFQERGTWYPLEQLEHPAAGRTVLTLAPGETAELQITAYRKYLRFVYSAYLGLEPGTYRLVLPIRQKGEAETAWLAAQFTVREDGSAAYAGEELELNVVIRDYARRLGEACVHPEEAANPLYPALSRFDPYVRSWQIRPDREGYAVTVHRDRDLERARALLADFENVKVVRGEDPAVSLSPVTEENLGSRGELRAELVPQTDPRLYRESTWLLRFRWDGDGPQQLELACYPERRSAGSGLWYALPYHHRTFSGEYGPAGSSGYLPTLTPGENTMVISLGDIFTEFEPGTEYRFVLAVPAPSGGYGYEYYVCPFAVTERGEA